MRLFILLFIIIFHSLSACAQNDLMQDRQDLQRLLAERAARFNSYTESIKKRSGIFGNQTKADIRKSNEVLIQIVTSDNKLIDAMNRILSYKTFERTTSNYESVQVKEKLQQSMLITDTLSKQLNKLEVENKHLSARNIKLKGLCFLCFSGLLVTSYLLYKRRKKDEQKNISQDGML